MSTLKLSDFDYHLPQERIAQSPAEPRDSSRLLILDRNSGQLSDHVFRDIADMLTSNDVLVVNETKVINARLKGFILEPSSLEKRGKRFLRSDTREGTEESLRLCEGDLDVSLRSCEIFLHKQITDTTWDCLVYPGRKLKVGAKVIFSQPLSLKKGEDSGESGILSATILSNSEKGRMVEFSKGGQEFLDIIEMIGETPLPPYIKEKHESDTSRYQTVYHDREKSGSVAAPTAGLHFTPELLDKLQTKGVQIEKVCLHVGLGTFANVEVEDIRDHHMHSEQAYISREVSERLNTEKAEGKRIIAVGTTSVRTLESFTDDNGHLGHGTIDTEIFIYPGYEWRFVESIITNFHLPKSTLVMLVSSFAGSENIKKAYQHAVDSEYRFFSYGDAMFIS